MAQSEENTDINTVLQILSLYPTAFSTSSHSVFHCFLITMSSPSLSDISVSEDFLPSDTDPDSSQISGSVESSLQTQSTRPGTPDQNLQSPLHTSNAVNASSSSALSRSRLTSPIHTHVTLSIVGGSQYCKCTYCKITNSSLIYMQRN